MDAPEEGRKIAVPGDGLPVLVDVVSPRELAAHARARKRRTDSDPRNYHFDLDLGPPGWPSVRPQVGQVAATVCAAPLGSALTLVDFAAASEEAVRSARR